MHQDVQTSLKDTTIAMEVKMCPTSERDSVSVVLLEIMVDAKPITESFFWNILTAFTHI